MATAGAKPKPTALRLVTGIKSRRQTAGPAPVASGRPMPPLPLKGRYAEIWDTWVAQAWWLTFSDSHSALARVYLAREVEATKGAMLAARLANFRALSNELGFNPSARERLGTGTEPPDTDEADHFLSNRPESCGGTVTVPDGCG